MRPSSLWHPTRTAEVPSGSRATEIVFHNRARTGTVKGTSKLRLCAVDTSASETPPLNKASLGTVSVGVTRPRDSEHAAKEGMR